MIDSKIEYVRLFDDESSAEYDILVNNQRVAYFVHEKIDAFYEVYFDFDEEDTPLASQAFDSFDEVEEFIYRQFC